MKTVLTTADVAERKRFQFWQDAVCDTFVELDCQARGSAPFFGEITTAECDGLRRDGLEVLVYNLTRVVNIMGIQPLMAAIKA